MTDRSGARIASELAKVFGSQSLLDGTDEAAASCLVLAKIIKNSIEYLA